MALQATKNIAYLVFVSWFVAIVRFGYRIQGIPNNFTWREVLQPPEGVTELQRALALSLPMGIVVSLVIIRVLWIGV